MRNLCKSLLHVTISILTLVSRFVKIVVWYIFLPLILFFYVFHVSLCAITTALSVRSARVVWPRTGTRLNILWCNKKSTRLYFSKYTLFLMQIQTPNPFYYSIEMENGHNNQITKNCILIAIIALTPSPSTTFVFFGPIRKQRWPPWHLIGRYAFDFSSATAERVQQNFTTTEYWTFFWF